MIHVIRNQYLSVDLQGTEPEGMAMHQRLPGLFNSVVAPAIEQALDTYAEAEKVLVIDKLEIDLGSIALANLETELGARIYEALAALLTQKKQSKPEAGNSSGSETTQTSPRLVNKSQRTIEAFLHFLRTGTLPWWFSLNKNVNLEQTISALLLQMPQDEHDAAGAETATTEVPLPTYSILKTHTDELWQLLREPGNLNRLMLQFSMPFVHLILREIADPYYSLTQQLLKKLQSLAVPLHERNVLERLFTQKAISLAVAHAGRPDEQTLLQEVRHELLADAPMLKLFGQLFADTKTTYIPLQTSEPPHITPSKPVKSYTRPDEGLFVPNAGIVLLHPFLPVFFEGLEIASAGQIADQEKALALLAYLATGTEETPEYELVLPKLLTNVPLASPVPLKTELNENERLEADALLDAVLKHWDALRQTSRDGLRGSFLLRHGKLTQKTDGSWLLQIEPQTYDILLDHLPWSISMIQLPWMENMLWVEWN